MPFKRAIFLLFGFVFFAIACELSSMGDEVIVSELREDAIMLAYKGDAITGAELGNTQDGHFSLQTELSYSGFALLDVR